MRRNEEKGVALVVTLILLTVITVIAVAFLAVTSRERQSVSETMSNTDSEFGASAGLERSKGEILGAILNLTTNYPNLYNSDLRVSTTFPSYLSTNQHPGLDLSRANPETPPDPFNLNYEYDRNLTPFTNYTTKQWHDYYERFGANLLYDARVPVFVNTNRGGGVGPLDFRHYLDLNRNGAFERTGFLPAVGLNGAPLLDTNGVPLTNLFVGDPQWIGILQYPNLHHSHTNKFIARYAYMIVPAGKTLDINYVGNHANPSIDPGTGQSFYRRNQSVGTWEINLGAFLTDLNTNAWFQNGYTYDPASVLGNAGDGFVDSSGLLAFRYRGSLNNLPTAGRMFGFGGAIPQFADGIDAYLNGPLTTTTFGNPFPVTADTDNSTTSWVAGESKQHFFRPDDFVTGPADYQNFRNHLQNASRSPSTYDRHTFYRLVSQMGTDSAPESDVEVVRRTDGTDETIVKKININYQNVGIDSTGKKAAATNLVNWSAPEFFSNTVRLLVRQEYPAFITNDTLRIPVYTNGVSRFTNGIITVPVLTPRLRQIFQIAANIWEATTNSRYPSVYRPVYHYEGARGDVYISGFVEDSSSRSITLADWVDLDVPGERASLQGNPTNLVYNIGVIIGARKNLPNFNEFKNMTTVQVSRKLEFPKLAVTDTRPNRTNQQFNIAITNSTGVEYWNSYTKPFLGLTTLRTFFTNAFALTNSAGLRQRFFTGRASLIPTNNWLGTNFIVPAGSNEVVIPPQTYVANPPGLIPIGTNFVTDLSSYTTSWGLEVTNKFRSFISDDAADRIIDAVGIAMRTHFNISAELDRPIDQTGNPGANVWSKQASGPTSVGVRNQILVGMDPNVGNYASYWADYSGGNYNVAMINEFARYLVSATDKPNMNCPYTPVRTIIKTNSLAVNDPLVHYTVEDLLDEYPFDTNGVATVSSADTNNMSLKLGRGIHSSYKPWGTRGSETVDYKPPGDPEYENSAPYYDERIKDSMVTRSDDWQFPNQKFPSVGWLGRVHRGTPWQTINLKGFRQEANFNEWRQQARLAFQAENHPTNDWRLADLFTTAIHPNATKGQLSVNQTNLAAWSAVLSAAGVTTFNEDAGKNPVRANTLIEPSARANAVIGDPLATIVDGIRRQKEASTNHQFFTLSEFLATPELTAQSPYLAAPFIPQSATSEQVRKTMLTDLDYERIPDQILSLVKVGDTRFVVYAFGQSLKPAPNLPDYASVVTSGPYAGMVINYQITGEVATRAVVRVDFERELNPASTNYLKFNYRRPHAVVESFNVLPPN